MSDEKRKVITEFYDEMAEELSIWFKALCIRGFTPEQALEIVVCSVCDNPANFRNARKEALKGAKE